MFLIMSTPAYAGVLGTMRAWAARAMGFAKGAGVQLEQRQQVKDAHAKHQSALTELTGKLAELQRKLGQDFGPSGVFAALLDRYVFWHHYEYNTRQRRELSSSLGNDKSSCVC